MGKKIARDFEKGRINKPDKRSQAMHEAIIAAMELESEADKTLQPEKFLDTEERDDIGQPSSEDGYTRDDEHDNENNSDDLVELSTDVSLDFPLPKGKKCIASYTLTKDKKLLCGLRLLNDNYPATSKKMKDFFENFEKIFSDFLRSPLEIRHMYLKPILLNNLTEENIISKYVQKTFITVNGTRYDLKDLFDQKEKVNISEFGMAIIIAQNWPKMKYLDTNKLINKLEAYLNEFKKKHGEYKIDSLFHKGAEKSIKEKNVRAAREFAENNIDMLCIRYNIEF